MLIRAYGCDGRTLAFSSVCFLGRGEAFLVPIPIVGREKDNKHKQRGIAVFVLDPLKKDHSNKREASQTGLCESCLRAPQSKQGKVTAQIFKYRALYLRNSSTLLS